MFETKGDRPQWAGLYDVLSQGEIGDLFGYSILSGAAGYDIRENRGPLYDAIKQLELRNKRTAENVVGVGYRIVEPNEHRGIGIKHQKKARRSVGRGLRKVEAADTSLLTAAEAVANANVQAQLSGLKRALGKTDEKVEQINVRVQKIEAENELIQATKLEDLRLNLERLGVLPGDKFPVQPRG